MTLRAGQYKIKDQNLDFLFKFMNDCQLQFRCLCVCLHNAIVKFCSLFIKMHFEKCKCKKMAASIANNGSVKYIYINICNVCRIF